MPTILLPDGSERQFSEPVSGFDIAADIGPGLAKSAVAIKLDGIVKDLATVIDDDADVKIITNDDAEALELIRHDAAHVLAEAVQQLFPGTQVTIGPNIENGFYYDFARETPFSTDDLEIIEDKMREIIDRDAPFVRHVWDREEAVKYFEGKGEVYKAEIIRDLAKNEEVSIYTQGDWTDLCRGPHMPSTGRVGKAFKLMKVSGAYWRGNERNEMLQRIYGTAWRNGKELRQHLRMLEEAEKRDHRRLGRQMGLFHQQEQAAGAVFWHPKGWRFYRVIQDYVRKRLEAASYVEVNTPQMLDRSLWEASGHWDKFRENMFVSEAEEKILAIKPMNCPCHVQIFKQGLKSYRDLPLRMAEFGSCHRNEPSGALHGLMRVRAFVQDDAHIFCLENQIEAETKLFIDLLASIYRDFGFEEFVIKFSDRPEVRAGSDAVWDRAEQALMDASLAAGANLEMNPGEGAFYGPKLEFVLRDAIGRHWQCGTLQVDFVLPDRLDAKFIGEDGNKHRPVMLHRAILGSFERFIGILIEHYAGRFPLWLSPLQVVIATITSDFDDYALQVENALKEVGLYTEVDLRNEKINYKIREHSHAKVPVILVVGQQEAKNGTVALRRLGGKDQEILALQEAVDRLEAEAQSPGS